MNSKFVDILMISLIIIYVVLVIANVVMNDPAYIFRPDVTMAVQNIKYAEIAILGFFVLELLLKVCALGIKVLSNHD